MTRRNPLFQTTRAQRAELRRPPARVSGPHRQREHRSRVRPTRAATTRRHRRRSSIPGRFTTELYGIDATYRWKPLQRSIYHSFVGRTEWIWSRRDQPNGLQSGSGMYVSGDYQFARRWFAGARYDRIDHAGRRVGARHRRIVRAHLLAERVQPGARPVSGAPITRSARQPTSSCSSSSSPSARTGRIRFKEVLMKTHSHRSPRLRCRCCSSRTSSARRKAS